MRSRRAALLALVLLLVSLLSPAQHALGRGTRTPRVAFLVRDTTNVRWFKDVARMKSDLRRLYPGAVVDAASANDDPLVQLGQADAELAKGARVLVVVPVDPKAAASIVRTAHRDGARVIAYDTPIASRNLDLYDGYDDRAIGSAQAGWLVAHAHRKGSIVMINGARSNPQAQLLHQGAYQVLGPRFRSGYFKMGGDFWTASGTATEAKRALDRYLHAHHNLVQGVLAADDELATGAQYSLGDVGLLGRTPLTGEDATVVALRRILTGDQGMTVYKPFTPEADAAAAAAAAFLHHKPVPRLFNKRVTVPGGSVRAALLSPMVITRSNVDRVLQDGVVTKKQVCAGLPKQTCASL